MTTPKFTPGPWHVAYDDSNGQAVVSGQHTEVATCWHHCVGSLEKEMRHNARLIAAAPACYKLLAAIRATRALEGVEDELASELEQLLREIDQ